MIKKNHTKLQKSEVSKESEQIFNDYINRGGDNTYDGSTSLANYQ